MCGRQLCLLVAGLIAGGCFRGHFIAVRKALEFTLDYGEVRHFSPPTPTPGTGSPPSQKKRIEGDGDGNDVRPCAGKEKIVALLKAAGVTQEMDCSKLPDWEYVSRMYGSEPVIQGLERCASYRDTLKGSKPRVRVAGMFNTGTNNLAKLLEMNVEKLGNRFRHEAPFGKHLPVKYFGNNIITKNKEDETAEKTHFLPVVTVRDPFLWLKALCKKNYDIHWLRPLDAHHCPIMLPTKDDLKLEKFLTNKTARARVVMAQVTNRTKPQAIYPSVAHVWKEYYEEWIEAQFPRLIIRSEDLVFHGPKVIRAIADCAGLRSPQTFQYNLDPAKSHGSSNFTDVLSQYRGHQVRYGNLTVEDIKYVRGVLDKRLLAKFQYPEVPVDITWPVYQPN